MTPEREAELRKLSQYDKGIGELLDALAASEKARREADDERDASLTLMRKREQPWIEEWRAEKPDERELMLPDYGGIMWWICDKAAAARREVEALRGAWKKLRATGRSEVGETALPGYVAFHRTDINEFAYALAPAPGGGEARFGPFVGGIPQPAPGGEEDS